MSYHYNMKRKSRDVDKDFELHESDFKYEIQQKIKSGKKGKHRYTWKTIEQKQFRTNTETRIFVIHKISGQKRLRAFGQFNQIPIYGRHPDLYSDKKLLSGKFFIPTKGKPKRKGNWVPVSSIVKEIQKELEQFGQELKHDVAGVVIPVKNYYHTKWQIYSDTYLTGNERWQGAIINCVVEYVYTNQQWIGKRNIVLDFRHITKGKGIKIKNLHKYTDRWEFELQEKLDELKQNRRGEVNLIAINGYMPMVYFPEIRNKK